VHPVAPTTHTVELEQLAQINDALQASAARRVSAEELALDGAPLVGRGVRAALAPLLPGHTRLPGYALLSRVAASGPPEYPYVHGHFTATPWRQGDLVVELHTTALAWLSHRLDLHHLWGVR
jgi:hypothetical protein